MNKLKYLLMIFVFILIIGILLPENYSNGTVSDEVGSVVVSQSEAKSNISPIQELIGTILGFLQVLSSLILVVVIALTGFSYITADTPDIKRELKEKMLPIVIGIVLVFGAVSITNFMLGVTS